LWKGPFIPIPSSDLLEGLILHILNGRQWLIPVAALSPPFRHSDLSSNPVQRKDVNVLSVTVGL
jgi:hypothetical protein